MMTSFQASPAGQPTQMSPNRAAVPNKQTWLHQVRHGYRRTRPTPPDRQRRTSIFGKHRLLSPYRSAHTHYEAQLRRDSKRQDHLAVHPPIQILRKNLNRTVKRHKIRDELVEPQIAPLGPVNHLLMTCPFFLLSRHLLKLQRPIVRRTAPIKRHITAFRNPVAKDDSAVRQHSHRLVDDRSLTDGIDHTTNPARYHLENRRKHISGGRIDTQVGSKHSHQRRLFLATHHGNDLLSTQKTKQSSESHRDRTRTIQHDRRLDANTAHLDTAQDLAKCHQNGSLEWIDRLRQD